ncbi:conserved hypothetical protein [Chloroflexus aggregans DSM 9485]|uniref:PPM-type phosphatase domain-containing protein n=2 Tax=Chloroflexus aggregans TaxID=152260 RepID=B8G4Q8_CHLAD|nr:conserved hypothetical protein [Chloroflexus aggregans DSM 9485]
MQPLEIRTGSQVTVAGTTYTNSTRTLIVTPDPHQPEAINRGQLFVLCEPVGPLERNEHACQIVTKAIRQTFYEGEATSAASALRLAIIAANKALYQDNMRCAPAQRVTVGVTALVLLGNDLFIAQIQPTQLFLRCGGKLRAIPTHPSWDPAQVNVAQVALTGSLGASLFVEPEFFRAVLQPGDALLLSSSTLVTRFDPPTMTALLAQADVSTILAAAQERATDVPAIELLALTVHTPSPKPIAVPSPTPTHRLLPWFHREPPPPPRPTEPDPERIFTPPPQPALSPNPIPRPAPIDLGEPLAERVVHQPTLLPPSSTLGEEPSPSPPIDLGDPIPAAPPYGVRYRLRPRYEQRWYERLAWPWQMLSDWVREWQRERNLRRKALTVSSYVPRGRGLTYRRTTPPFPWPLVLTTVLVVSGVILYGMNLTRSNELQLALEYLTAAEERVAAVRTAPDETAAREALQRAQQAIEIVRASPEITTTNPGLWLRYNELEREYERLLAAIDHISFIEPTVLASHPLPNGIFTTIIVPPAMSGVTDPDQLETLRYIYALDGNREASRLYRIPRDGGTPEVYLEPGQIIGSAIVGPLRAALWRIDQVVAIDQAPNGFGYYFRQNNTWNYSKLGSSEIWITPERLDVEEYAGNLYVWGAQPGEVLKFASGRYGDTPEFWLNPGVTRDAAVLSAIDMAVDGSIYLLQPDGAVLVFSFGQLVGQIKPDNLSPPIAEVTRFIITGSPDAGFIFMLEPANERILQLDKRTGALIQQIRVRDGTRVDLSQLSALSIDTSGSRPLLYFASGNSIVRAELPSPPRSFREASTP